ncbi:MAG: ATP-binding cassette domain-containing protein [Alphaproteobacteria bacterium]|jgi:ATP-binding cassette subfamily B protein|nr:ATP-binding cassette domain-containing protein [Alphaproteobacteria bacterium]
MTQSQASSSNTIQNIKDILELVRPYRRPMVLATLSLTLAAGMVLSLGWALRSLIDYGFAQEDSAALDSILLLMGLAVAFLAIASFGRSYYIGWVGERVITDLRQRVFNHLLSLDVGFFELIRSGELVSRITTDTTLIQVVIGTSAAVAVRNLLLLGGGLVMMMATSLKLTLLTLIIVPFVLIPILIYGKRVRKLSKLTQDRIADVGGFLEETLGGIRTCQAFMHEDTDRRQFEDQTERAFDVSIKRIHLRSLLACLIMILVFGGVSLVLWIGGRDVLAGELAAGQLSAFIFYAVVVAASAGSFSEIFADLQRAIGALDRLRELLATAPSLAPVSGIPSRKLPIPSTGVVALHNICFAYPSNPERPILNNVTLSAAPGEKIAIVGPSGAGKSTILSLLLRFYSPQSGSIYLDGIDVRDVDVSEVRARMGLVPQDPTIFSQSLYENILYGRPNASETDVWRAAELAHLSSVIEDLPQGIHTLLGTKGVRLSGGQKQRLAIARAILRNPSILLLDEATSALDSESEHLVQQSLNHLMATRTTIVIAHRLATVLKADRIIVMDRGQINAVGTHAELISEDGLYRRLAMMQYANRESDTRWMA